MKKRIFAFFLTLCMLLSLLPAGVLADDAPTSGACGENLSWIIDDGTLTISGAGKMQDFEESAPWRYYFEEIEKIVIENGVTTIGDWAFGWCEFATSVEIPDTVTEIGECAFRYCRVLEDVVLPNSVRKIGAYAFCYCPSLTSFMFPDGITTISAGMFYVNNLKSVTIPKSVTTIEGLAFVGSQELTDVYYGGSKADWEKIVIDGENDALLNATIHYGTAESTQPTTPDKPTIPATSPFVDVQDTPATNWYYTPVLWAVANNVTNGISDTEFAPNNTCTRAQAVAFLWRAAGRPEPSSTVNPFVDVADTADTNWYYKAVLWAVEQGITTGTDETHFSPDGEVSRGQMVTFLWRMHEKPDAEGSTFADVPANEYYYNAVSWAVSQGITNGTDEAANTFEPLTTCSRAHIVTFLYRDMAK